MKRPMIRCDARSMSVDIAGGIGPLNFITARRLLAPRQSIQRQGRYCGRPDRHGAARLAMTTGNR